eukprot:4120285-Prymnesium_polylepis.1
MAFFWRSLATCVYALGFRSCLLTERGGHRSPFRRGSPLYDSPMTRTNDSPAGMRAPGRVSAHARQRVVGARQVGWQDATGAQPTRRTTARARAVARCRRARGTRPTPAALAGPWARHLVATLRTAHRPRPACGGAAARAAATTTIATATVAAAAVAARP